MHTIMLSKYLNLSLLKPFISRKSKYLTMSCSDVIVKEKVEVSLAILIKISVIYKALFSDGNQKYFC